MKFRLHFLLAGALWPAALLADSAVVFNEIAYHPLTNEPAFEWIELHNQHAVDIDLSGWRLDGGIDFNFTEGTILRGGGYLVVASSPAELIAATGATNVAGPFRNRLSNAGDTLRLRNNDNRLIDQLSYGVDGDWPIAPDGAGPSLARRRANLRGADARNWQASAQIGGTPGTENFPIRPPTILSNTLVAIEGGWKFNDSGTDLGTAWRAPGFNDSTWSSGAALFYQGAGPLPAGRNTPLTPGRLTYYFRTQFVVTGDPGRVQLLLRPLVDDGAVGYLNGVEIFRVNMPPGAIAYGTLANGLVGDAAYGPAFSLAPEQWVAGTNVLAVEVHQASLGLAYSQTVLESGPIAYWRLGESSGAALDSALDAAAPQSGAQNGTYAGFLGSNLAQPGPRPADVVNAQALAGFDANNATPRFAGNTDGGNDVITIPDSGVFNFAATRLFTLEAWVNAAAVQEDGAAVIAKGPGGGGEQFAIDVVGGGLYRFFAWDGGSPNTPAVVTASVGPNNTWQHVVAVLDQPAGRMKIYVNGVERGSGAPRATVVNSAHEVSIGARKNSGSSSYDLNFSGRIDEVAIYNRALPTNEIVAHFNAAFSTNTVAGPDTNDVVFGLEVVAAETQPESDLPTLAFNELASSTNSAFWLELINSGRTNADLHGWVIARIGGLTNRHYTLPSQMLAPGELRTVTKVEMGFGVDSGDRLVLYTPGRSKVADAVVAKKDPRGRSPDGDGAWWFPAQPTPGTSNYFVFRDELVINEIMYHQRELPPVPATFSPTNLLLTITNLWRYHALGLDLGTAWRAPDYDDSAWPASNAVFYAPTNFSVLPAPKSTFLPLTNAAGARITTFYFRTQFLFGGDTNGLMLGLRAIIDDGAIFHLNGVEVYRLNMPETNILYGTLATVNVGVPGFTGPVLLPASSLVPGLNTLAVEVHQVVPNSGDMDFGAELSAWKQLTPALPFRDSPESWVEILNRSSNEVSLAGWRLDEGIDYRFATNKSIAPGGFLVVAKDVSFMRTLHPGLDVVGPFTNKLSRSSEWFVLKDPNNNPADEVRYFGGGRWPQDADGGGSSLELRDPRADNTTAEAWAASDESGRAPWQTYTWRGVSAPGQPGEPTLWHEFALAVLDGAGEFLLDDVSVIETPTTTPKQLIHNGQFDGGSAAHWRFLGNHRLSRVEPETGHPGNHVLHVIASGAGEYQGNQIETTLTNNLAIVDGREYEISFRARWLAGKSKLNARLYFNRLARTVDLPTPARSGTPGAVNSRYVPNVGPTFSDFAHSPVVPDPGRPVTVSVTASDPDGLAAMTLRYSVAGSAWQSVPMTLRATRLAQLDFTGSIPGQPASSIVQFYVEGVDTAGATATFPARGTNSRALYVVQDNAAIANGAHNFRLVLTPADASLMLAATNALSNELLGATVIYDEREVTWDVGVRLKGSFVGRNVDRVGFHLQFPEDHLFRGEHRVVSVDRSQHTVVGGVAEIVAKHVAAHAGGIPAMYDDIARFIHTAAPGYNSACALRLTGFDDDWLDAQFEDGSDGELFEVEVLRWHTSTVDGNPESPKPAGPNNYANLEAQDYGDAKESYRWFLLKANNRTQDEFERGIAWSKTLGLTGTNFDAQAAQILDVDQWLRVLAFQSLVGVADGYYTAGNVHNFRIFVRPVDGKVIYMPWDWDSAFQLSPSASLFGGGNIAKLLGTAHNHRQYLSHLSDLIGSTYNGSYLSRWTAHYGALAQQDLSGVLSYVNARASFVLGQLPNATFAVTNQGGNNFAVTNGLLTLGGSAPLGVRTILINGIPYLVTWVSDTIWTLRLPLNAGANLLVVQGYDGQGRLLTNALDTITVTNTGPGALRPVVINEWMADNAGPYGVADPADGLFQDWLELFNPNDTAVNLSGYHLTDNLGTPTKWKIPGPALIGAQGFLLVWADNETNQNTGLPGDDLHAPFQLSAGGESIGLYSPDGVTPQSTVSFGSQMQNLSQGRFPDGATNDIHSMVHWTPRAPNSLTIGLTVTEFSVNPGSITLSWGAIPGRAYRLQFKDSLELPAWTPLGGDIIAGGPTASATDTSLPSPAQRFYRVQLVQ